MSVSLWQFIGFSVTSVLGILLHFLYNLTGQNKIAALFSATNESTWEHMKIIFFPMLIFAVIQNLLWNKKYNSFWCIKLKGILLGTSLIPIIFYTYNGIFGKSPDFINIAIFFVCAAIAFIYETGLFSADRTPCKCKKCAIFVLCVVSVLFFIFTFYPPQIPLFLDPLTQ